MLKGQAKKYVVRPEIIMPEPDSVPSVTTTDAVLPKTWQEALDLAIDADLLKALEGADADGYSHYPDASGYPYYPDADGNPVYDEGE